MEPHFTVPKAWDLQVSDALPAEYSGNVLRGATVVAAAGEKGNILIQSIEQPLFTIRYKVIEFLRVIKIPFKHKAARLMCLFALKSDVRYKLKGLGALQLNAGEFSLFHSNETSFTAQYQKGKACHSLEINWSDEVLKEAGPYFSVLDPVLKPNPPNKNFFVGRPTHKADHKMIELANELLKSPYDAAVSELLFQHKVREYLILILVAVGRQPAEGLHLTEEERKKIDEIAGRLRTEPNKKFPISQLAAGAQMSPTKLKLGFKEKYNSGMFEYQMAWRMKEAMRLLQETNLIIKEIKDRIGYKSLSSFITKFREHHGYPPGKVLRPRA